MSFTFKLIAIICSSDTDNILTPEKNYLKYNFILFHFLRNSN